MRFFRCFQANTDDNYKFVSAFYFPPVTIIPIYSAGTSKLSLTEQPQNFTLQPLLLL